MSINGLNVTSPTSARIWSELKDLSNTEKIELIALLSSSMTVAHEQTDSHKKGWASRFAGTWKDSRSAEEIVRDIRSARTTNSFDVELFGALQTISSDEGLMKKAVRSLKRIAAQKAKTEDTLSLEEIVRQGEEEIAKGNLQPVAIDDLWK